MGMITYEIDECPTFGYGDRFYKVEEYPASGRSGHEFSTKCPVCGGKKRLTVKGQDEKDYDIACPECQYGFRGGNKIYLRHWTVVRYTVHEHAITGPKYKSKYDRGKPVPSIVVRGFCPFGDSNLYANAPKGSVDMDVSKLKLDDYGSKHNGYTFSSRDKARVLLKALQDIDRKKLAEFNERYGTDYEYPYGDEYYA